MTIQIKCPNCGRKLYAKEGQIGTSSTCPACGKTFVVCKPDVFELAPEEVTPERKHDRIEMVVGPAAVARQTGADDNIPQVTRIILGIVFGGAVGLFLSVAYSVLHHFLIFGGAEEPGLAYLLVVNAVDFLNIGAIVGAVLVFTDSFKLAFGVAVVAWWFSKGFLLTFIGLPGPVILVALIITIFADMISSFLIILVTRKALEHVG